MIILEIPIDLNPMAPYYINNKLRLDYEYLSPDPIHEGVGGSYMKDYNLTRRILVTGGAGFIGSHLSQKLLEFGHEVICVDNFYTGTKSNIKDLLQNPLFEVLRHDICFPLYVEVDQIYNLACPASPIHYQFDPVQTTKSSVHGSINMLGLAKRLGIKILQASTSEVYGNPTIHPQKEDYWGNVNPIGLRSCYDESKRCAETLFFDYHRQHKLQIKVARIFNTYGPQMHPKDGRVVSNFIVQAIQNKPLTVFGQGSQTRSFCYVDDLVDGLIKLMESPKDVTGPINLGNPQEITITELAKKIIELTRSKSKIIHKQIPEDDPLQRQPDITLARQKLNWKPATTLEDGLKKTIDYFRKTLP
jgi:UDP-glucuronate decarboxylase